MKKLLIIGAVLLLVALLAVPASAIWSNGNWVTDEEYAKLTKGNTVKYDPVTDVSSKYGNKPDINLMTNQGMVKGILKSGSVVSGGERFLFHRVGTPDNVTLAQYFGPDGLYTGYLAPGEYDVILPQGTGSACGIYSDDWGYVGNPHEERTRITVVAGQVTQFSFIGNSIPSYGGNTQTVIDHCKDIVVTVSNIHQHGHGWSYYAFDMTVKGKNTNKFQAAPVEVKDSKGHTLFNFFVIATGTNQYTVSIPVDFTHASHNPLTINVGDTTCSDVCHGRHCDNGVDGAYCDENGIHNH